jgi:5-methylcytosine-specific restriction endonuclease McrA
LKNSKLERNSEYSEAQRQAEIDAAWESHNLSDYAAQAKQRKQWLERHLTSQNGLCAYCSIAITETPLPGAEDRRATIDHVIPRSKGGPEAFENTLAVCAYCNVAKGSLSVDEYKATSSLVDRLKKALVAPDRLSNDPNSPYYDYFALERGVGIRFNGRERTDVYDYSVTEGWIRIRAGKSFDRHGKPVTIKLSGTVEPFYKDAALLLNEIRRRSPRSRR